MFLSFLKLLQVIVLDYDGQLAFSVIIAILFFQCTSNGVRRYGTQSIVHPSKTFNGTGQTFTNLNNMNQVMDILPKDAFLTTLQDPRTHTSFC